MFGILASDFLKIRRKMIWFLIFLGPIGVLSLQAVNFTLRYEYLTDLYKADLWGGLMNNVTMLAVPTIFIGLAIITSMIANIEHQTNSWKQVLALPISKFSVFTAKFTLGLILLFVSSTLLGLGTIILGLVLKFGSSIPYLELLKIIYYPYFAVMPFIALQIWLAITYKNQATALTIGIIGTVVSMYAVIFPDWVPYKWPTLENQWGEPLYSVGFGLLVGLLIYLMGLLDFIRRDVK
ncbi:ABC transporter permease [Bacillus sp. 31A1R]|uniref:ABC transporter permease n=1 Tax=Robertmurraya mangrovi TaxID=3098077 RepID=A0ABU5IXA2_9BACI|nr:ABC transporter permease [Bacillus sp. 31A1R]MDZ5471742.1 ABC transporter permease [Bacillus sp. 31A1R]